MCVLFLYDLLNPGPCLPRGPTAATVNTHQTKGRTNHRCTIAAEPGPQATASKLKVPRRQLASSSQREQTGRSTSWTRRGPAATCKLSTLFGDTRCHRGQHGVKGHLIVQLVPALLSLTPTPNLDNRRSASAQGLGFRTPTLNAVQASKQERERACKARQKRTSLQCYQRGQTFANSETGTRVQMSFQNGHQTFLLSTCCVIGLAQSSRANNMRCAHM